MKRLRIAGLAAALLAAASAASAGIVLEGVYWQIAEPRPGRVPVWRDVRELEWTPPRLGRLRARLVLRNSGTSPEEGLLIRYSLAARLSPSSAPATDANWAIPFSVDERRVAEVKPGAVVEVPLEIGVVLRPYLRSLARANWRPDRLRVRAMLEPRYGSKDIQTVEGLVDVKTGAAK
ncbi:MAG: hypothetical protein KGM24_10560 [Elusimicrobia bacterium]|nr:hypothetical protein [Elusimicrobiota bacterium]